MGPFRITMSDDENFDAEFESAGAGASDTQPIQAGNIKKGSFVVIKNRPCKVVETSTSKTGKHGHAKVHMVALDIFNGAKKEDISPSSHNMLAPVVKRDDYTLLSVDDEGFCSLMQADGTTKDDLRLPENELGGAIKELVAADKELILTVVSAMGEEHILSHKESMN